MARWSPILTGSRSLVVVMLLAGCGGGDSGGGGGAGTPAPTAQANADETVPVGTPTAFDGSASESPTGTPLSYQWTLTARPSGSTASLKTFAGRLAFDGTTFAVGAADNTCATGFNPAPGLNNCPLSGAVFLFTRTATSWAQRAFVKASNPDVFDLFGNPAIDGNTLAVGAVSEDSCATGINGNQSDNNCGPGNDETAREATGSGAVYVYVLQ